MNRITSLKQLLMAKSFSLVGLLYPGYARQVYRDSTIIYTLVITCARVPE